MQFAFRGQHVRRREEDVVEQAGVDEFLGRPVGRGGEKSVGGGGGRFGGDHEVDEPVGIGLRCGEFWLMQKAIEPERGAFEGDEDLDGRVLALEFGGVAVVGDEDGGLSRRRARPGRPGAGAGGTGLAQLAREQIGGGVEIRGRRRVRKLAGGEQRDEAGSSGSSISVTRPFSESSNSSRLHDWRGAGNEVLAVGHRQGAPNR